MRSLDNRDRVNALEGYEVDAKVRTNNFSATYLNRKKNVTLIVYCGVPLVPRPNPSPSHSRFKSLFGKANFRTLSTLSTRKKQYANKLDGMQNSHRDASSEGSLGRIKLVNRKRCDEPHTRRRMLFGKGNISDN